MAGTSRPAVPRELSEGAIEDSALEFHVDPRSWHRQSGGRIGWNAITRAEHLGAVPDDEGNAAGGKA